MAVQLIPGRYDSAILAYYQHRAYQGRIARRLTINATIRYVAMLHGVDYAGLRAEIRGLR